MLYYMLVGEFPFEGGEPDPENNLDRISNIRKNEFKADKLEALKIDPSIIELIRSLLAKNPNQRPTHLEILKHPKVVELESLEESPSQQDTGLRRRLDKYRNEEPLDELQQVIHEWDSPVSSFSISRVKAKFGRRRSGS